MIQPDPKPEDFENRINEYLSKDELLSKLGARVLPGTAHQETWGWTVSVGTEDNPPKTLEFVDRLSEISEQFKEHEHVDVLIAPSGVKPSEM
jgi:hypothetical protein